MSTEERAENAERQLAAARHVDLVDAMGKRRVMVYTGKDGPKLLLLDKTSEWIGILYLTGDEPVKVLFCEKDQLRGVLDVPTDTMRLNRYDDEQKLQSSFRTGDLRPIVELRGPEDKMQVIICVKPGNLEFLLHDGGGHRRASLAMGKDRGHLRLFDEKEEPIWSAP